MPEKIMPQKRMGSMPDYLTVGESRKFYEGLFEAQAGVFKENPGLQTAKPEPVLKSALESVDSSSRRCSECGGQIVYPLGNAVCRNCGLEVKDVAFARNKRTSEMTRAEKDDIEINYNNEENDVRTNL